MTIRSGGTVKPHPYELEKAITTDHITVFGYPEDGVQLEISGQTDAEELDIDWAEIELRPEAVDRILDEDVTYTEQCEDLAGREYTLEVRGGVRHPKGSPVWTRGDESDSDGFTGFCRVCGTDFEDLPEDEYKSEASRHILNRHGEADPDEVLVVNVRGERGDDE